MGVFLQVEQLPLQVSVVVDQLVAGRADAIVRKDVAPARELVVVVIHRVAPAVLAEIEAMEKRGRW